MASSLSHLLVFFLIILFIHPSQPSPNLIDRICKRHFDIEFCIQTLSSDANSANADLLGLTKISIDLLLRNASNTLAFIVPLVENTTELEKKKCLSNCEDLYNSSVQSINWAKELLLGGNKEPEWVDLYLESPSVYARLCNDSLTLNGFNEWPILSRNTNLFQLSLISEDIFSIMINPGLLDP